VTFYVKTKKESELQSDILDFAHIRRWFAQKIEFKGRTGGEDLVCIRDGRTIWIEVKREGEEARMKQEKVAREMRAHGAEVFLVDNMEDARRILK
jgi:hypothetical protein